MRFLKKTQDAPRGRSVLEGLRAEFVKKSLVIALTSTLQTSSDLNNYNNNKYENICIINNYVSHL